MCMARITWRKDDTELDFEVYADDSFPDVISECAAAVKRLYDEVMVDVNGVE